MLVKFSSMEPAFSRVEIFKGVADEIGWIRIRIGTESGIRYSITGIGDRIGILK